MKQGRYKVLLVDDDVSVLEFLSYNLVRHDFDVRTAQNGLEAIALAQTFMPDLIILDWMMPEMDGLEACRRLRSDSLFDETIIALLTAKDDDFSRIEAFAVGADDYIHKSIRPKVFVAKMEALLRRKMVPKPRVSDVITIFDLEIFLEKRLVRKAGKKLALTKIEFDLLNLFLSNKNKVFSRQEIHDAIWGKEVIVGNRTLDVHIRNLRKKVGEQIIVTSKGVGYTLG